MCCAILVAALWPQMGFAQQKGISLKSGESLDLHKVWFITRCRSMLTAAPEVEVMDGPSQLTLTIRQEKVIPRERNCAKPVDGGTIVATAGKVEEPVHARLVYRTKYKTKDGDRQVSHTYNVDLFP
jgi:hypothetical protein